MNIILASVFVLISLLSPTPGRIIPNRANLIDAAGTYQSLGEVLGRTPTIQEVLFITAMEDETALSTLASDYYSFCEFGECASINIIGFLASQDSWRNESGTLDVNPDIKAFQFYDHLMQDKFSGDVLYEQIDTILATEPLEEVEESLIETSLPLPNSLQLEVKSINKSVDFLAPNTSDLGDLLDVERTFNAVTRLMGREPTIREMLYMTIWSEYWMVVSSSSSRVGQEAVARSYYQFCGIDGCSREELFKFLSGYRPWFGHPGYIDGKAEEMAEYLIMLLNHEFNYDCCGEFLYEQIDEILDVEYAAEKTWTLGKTWNGASQWDGPYGPPPGNATFGYGTNDFAIAVIKYPKHFGMGNNAYFYFVTWEQEQGFTDPGG